MYSILKVDYDSNGMKIVSRREFFFGPTYSMWKFPGQGLNLHHSSDSAESLTYWATRELLWTSETDSINGMNLARTWTETWTQVPGLERRLNPDWVSNPD